MDHNDWRDVMRELKFPSDRKYVPGRGWMSMESYNKYYRYMNGERQMIIGLHGLPESGKSEVAKFLVYHCGFHQIAFGDHLKRAAKFIYDLSDDQCWGSLKDVVDKRYGITPRFIFQKLGTEVCREIHGDTWLFPVERAIEKYPRLVVDDLRFFNEYSLLDNYGAKFIKIERPGHQPKDILPGHASNEPLQGTWDYTISNDKGLDELQFHIMLVAKSLGLIRNPEGFDQLTRDRFSSPFNREETKRRLNENETTMDRPADLYSNL